MNTLLLVNLAVSWALVGLIWTIQLVHYPSFSFVAEDHFLEFHRHHTRSITWVVMPLMLVELALAFYLASLLSMGMAVAKLIDHCTITLGLDLLFCGALTQSIRTGEK